MTIDNNSSYWLGLSSYDELHANMFFGRDAEIADLTQSIYHNIQTVVYGPSGIGKTSILRAGVFNRVRGNGYMPVYVRLDHNKENQIPFFLQIINEIERCAEEGCIQREQRVPYIDKECQSLWEYFHCNVFWNEDDHLITPLLLLDQFEEIFTLSTVGDSRAKKFFNQLSDLCNDQHPCYIRNHIEDSDEAIIYPERINYRCVISLREDFLARLEEYSSEIPSLRLNRYSLQPLTGMQALDIIMKPAPGLVSQQVAISILEKVTKREALSLDMLSHITVEPFLLSLFCSELDKKRQERKENTISLSLVNDFGKSIIRDYFRNAMRKISPESLDYLEHKLLTEEGFRSNTTISDAQKNGVTDGEIRELERQRIICRDRKSDGSIRIEFTHDVLCHEAKMFRHDRLNQAEYERQIESNARLQRLLKIAATSLFAFLIIGGAIIWFAYSKKQVKGHTWSIQLSEDRKTIDSYDYWKASIWITTERGDSLLLNDTVFVDKSNRDSIISFTLDSLRSFYVHVNFGDMSQRYININQCYSIDTLVEGVTVQIPIRKNIPITYPFSSRVVLLEESDTVNLQDVLVILQDRIAHTDSLGNCHFDLERPISTDDNITLVKTGYATYDSTLTQTMITNKKGFFALKLRDSLQVRYNERDSLLNDFENNKNEYVINMHMASKVFLTFNNGEKEQIVLHGKYVKDNNGHFERTENDSKYKVIGFYYYLNDHNRCVSAGCEPKSIFLFKGTVDKEYISVDNDESFPKYKNVRFEGYNYANNKQILSGMWYPSDRTRWKGELTTPSLVGITGKFGN